MKDVWITCLQGKELNYLTKVEQGLVNDRGGYNQEVLANISTLDLENTIYYCGDELKLQAGESIAREMIEAELGPMLDGFFSESEKTSVFENIVNNTIEKKGDGLLGLVLGTKNIKAFRERVSGFGFSLSESAEGEGESEQNVRRKWLYQFLPQEITRGIFSFVIEHKSKDLPFVEPDKSSVVPSVSNILESIPVT